jgi:hypothetical protein
MVIAVDGAGYDDRAYLLMKQGWPALYDEWPRVVDIEKS